MENIMPCTKHGSLMVCFVPFYQGPAPSGRSLDKAHIKYKEREQQRDFMIKYVQDSGSGGREGCTYSIWSKWCRRDRPSNTELPDVKLKPRLSGRHDLPHLLTTVYNWKSSQQFISIPYSTALLFDKKIGCFSASMYETWLNSFSK